MKIAKSAAIRIDSPPEYIDAQGRVLFVSDGISGGTSHFTCWRQPNGSLRRLKSKSLPERRFFGEAQADLNAYAARHKLKEHAVKSAKQKKTPAKKPVPAADTQIAGNTKRKRDRRAMRRAAARNNQGAPSVAQVSALKLSLVDPSPFQPRLLFPDADVAALAESMRREGQLQPIVVRQIATCKYELVDGERRVRAAKHLGWQTIRAEIRRASDAEARALILAAAWQHSELNPVEKARALSQCIDAGDVSGPSELAKLLGTSQGQVSNLLGLLRLPEVWQQRVISGEMTAAHARALVPHINNPHVLRTAEQWLEDAGLSQPVERFREAIDFAAGKLPRPAGGGGVSRKAAKTQSRQERTAEEEFENEEEEFAARNLPAGKKPPTAQKPEQEPATRLARAAAGSALIGDDFAARLWDWYCDWLSYLISRRLLADDVQDESLMLMAALLPSLSGPTVGIDREQWRYDLHDLLQNLRPARRNGPIETVLRLGDIEARELLAGLLARRFWGRDGSAARAVDDGCLPSIAAELNIAPLAEWTGELAGPLTERYWRLHNREQLLALGKDLKVKWPDWPSGPISQTAAAERMVTHLLSLGPTAAEAADLPFPRELKRIKSPHTESEAP